MHDSPTPVDYGWLTPLQHEAMLRVIVTPGDFARVAELRRRPPTRGRVPGMSFISGEIIRHVMAQTWGDFPGINTADLRQITRGVLSAPLGAS
jgi:hypothetical protein